MLAYNKVIENKSPPWDQCINDEIITTPQIQWAAWTVIKRPVDFGPVVGVLYQAYLQGHQPTPYKG